MNKTNAMRLLEAAKIPFRTAEYEVDEKALYELILDMFYKEVEE